MYHVEIRHEGLNKYKMIKGNELHVVEQKAHMQKKQWEEQWRKKKKAEEKKLAREKAAKQKEEKKNLAIQLTEEAIEQIDSVKNTLSHTLEIDDKINWEDLKDYSKFETQKPTEPTKPLMPEEPNKSDSQFQPDLNFIDKIITKFKEKKLNEANELFITAHSKWEKETERKEKSYKLELNKYENLLIDWQKKKSEFLILQKEKNNAIELEKELYYKKDSAAIVDYCDMVLTNSIYPDSFPQEFDIEFNKETKILIVDYTLPSLESVPNLKEVKYIQSRDEFKEVPLSQAAFNKMYDDLLYQISLRTIHELYEADDIDSIQSIVFNGWVNSIDKATGKKTNGCILSVQALRSEFMEINLANVDPKLCFKSLKGIGSSKLSSLTPIAPIVKIDRDDPRFVSAYDIADSIDDSQNLAAMDWQDFEQLIRELFEKEFNQSGGEVKITRASRDGGVDAVAFDPDPIRGGKIVIQAKRYTNVVGVSAVRDLYGTVLNEGATKGILVSTADYGPDAYNFSKDKPITLLNGNNLLHLLQKHGHKAKIDLKEAKEILNSKV